MIEDPIRWVNICIQKAEEPKVRVPVTPTRYPYTYAYDFLRGHAAVFGMPAEFVGSRSQTSAWLQEQIGGRAKSREWLAENALEGADYRHYLVCCKLADAYIREWDLVWEDDPTR